MNSAIVQTAGTSNKKTHNVKYMLYKSITSMPSHKYIVKFTIQALQEFTDCRVHCNKKTQAKGAFSLR